MCGIFGYSSGELTQEEIAKLLLSGLEKMEYRGYDSAGLCILNKNKLANYSRSVGRVSLLEQKIKITSSEKNDFLGIAHTRWATHGKSSEINAHPIRSDDDGSFFVVHNGIISNYAELKSMLISKGYTFSSQTDTEVACKLALMFYNENKKSSFADICRKVQLTCNGAFAFIFVSTLFPNQMIAVRQNAPVIVGVKNPISERFDVRNESFCMGANENTRFVVSSDISAIIDHTLDLVYLEDGDMAVIEKSGITIIPEYYGLGLDHRALIKTNTSIDSVIKGNFAHFMLKEIHEQGESILNTLRNRVDFENNLITLDTLEAHKEKLCNATRYLFIACGTSYHSSHATKKVFEELTDVPVVVEIASHFLDHQPKIYHTDVVFFISQSGETFDSLAALRYCRGKGAMTVGITNTPNSTMAKETTCRLDLHAGIEKGVASTKAYTSQFMSIILIGLFISQYKKTCESRRIEIVKAIEEMPSKIKQCLKINVAEFVNHLELKDSMLVVGRGYQAATCLEGALKIKEISYIHCEGILAGELKHGPLALVSEDKNVLMIIANDEFYQKSHSALEQIQARGATPFVICTDDLKDKYQKCITVPKTINCLQGLLTVIPFQLISYGISLKKGFDPDFPRNLAKSVTVE